MAGYIGTKAVLLSTTAATVTGDMTVGGAATISGAFTSLGIDDNAAATAMTLDASGNLLVGKTALDNTTAGHNFYASGFTSHVRDGGDVVILNRLTSDGDIAVFRKDGTTVGTIGTRYSDLMLGTAATGLRFYDQFNAITPWNMTTNDTRDGVISLGQSGDRFKDLYLSGNVLVGTTSVDPTVGTTETGIALAGVGYGSFSRSSGPSLVAGRNTTDGSVMLFKKGSDTVGSISVTTSATAYNTSSDYRLKEDWVPMVGASERVQALKPINFAWKVDGSRVDGFLAHELAEVAPEAATGAKDAMRDEEYEITPAVEATYDDEGVELTPAVPAVMGTRSVPDYQGIDQSKLVPLLTAALQEAITEITALKARVTALEAV